MHLSGKIMIPIGIALIILAAIGMITFDEEDYLQQLDQDGELTIKLFDEDKEGEIGFSFWIEGEYVDADDNGLWDDCEAFNASVTGPNGDEDQWYSPLCEDGDGIEGARKSDMEWEDLGLIKVGQACNSVVIRDMNGGSSQAMRCPDGDYLITANADSKVRYDDHALGEELGAWIGGGCCCCFGLLIVLLGLGFGFGLNPSRSQAATIQLDGASPAPITTDSGSVPGTVQGAIFGAGPAPQASDPPAGTNEETIQSSADALKKQFLAGAEDKVSDASEPEKE